MSRESSANDVALSAIRDSSSSVLLPFLGLARRCSLWNLVELADEAPATAELANGEHELVVAFFQGKVDGIVLRIDDAEKTGIAETLGAAAAIEDLAVQKDTDVITVTDRELFDLVSRGMDAGPCIKDFHTSLRVEAFGEIALESNSWMGGFAEAVKDDEAGRFGLYVLPLDGFRFFRSERAFEISGQTVERRRDAPVGDDVRFHCGEVPLPGSVARFANGKVAEIGFAD
jgi:hypothetical protein